VRIEGRAELQALFAAQGEQRWKTAATVPRERIEKLKSLRSAIIAKQGELYAAIWKDFRKPHTESWLSEVYPTIEELDCAIRRLRSWMRDERAKGALVLPLARSFLRREPKGRVLIMSPWNYPFQLLMTPLLSALAAGNVVIAKPSNKTPATSAFIAELIEGLFPREEVAIVEGPGSSLGELLLELPFDHVFFTGSPRVGARVGEAAARMHAGLTLELGGKSPAILLPSCDIEDAARKITWAKYLNAGQTCVAPDYLFCPRDSVAAFAASAKRAVERQFGADEAARRASPDLARLIDEAACRRLSGLVDEALRGGARLEYGGLFDFEERYAAPSLITGVRGDMAIMEQEIFGPILPVLVYDSLEEVIGFIQSRPKALALYLFGQDRSAIGEVLDRTSSGSVCINDLMLQIENPNLPFGGVGMSGTGSYHGRYGFATFSHERAVLRQGPLSLAASVYPPYAGKSRLLMRRILELLQGSATSTRAGL
jgi:aldehyde dehydrogenase (NAD+)